MGGTFQFAVEFSSKVRLFPVRTSCYISDGGDEVSIFWRAVSKENKMDNFSQVFEKVNHDEVAI